MTMLLDISLRLGSSARGEGGAGPWGPIDLGGKLIEWWTADDADSLTLSGGTASAWAGQKQGLVLSQATEGLRPAYQAAGFNGAPCLHSDGTKWMVLDAPAFPAGASPSEVWALCSQELAASTTEMRQVFTYGAAAASQRGIGRFVVSGVVRGMVRTGNGTGADALTRNTVALDARHVLRGVFGATSHAIEVDDDGDADGPIVPATVATRARLFANAGASAGQLWVGKVRDLLIIDGELTLSQATDLRNWVLPRRN